ncbi:PQ loop repeat family protein, partial [Plasmodium cynomolgi strain B]
IDHYWNNTSLTAKRDKKKQL